jgi:hypothetical protein
VFHKMLVLDILLCNYNLHIPIHNYISFWLCILSLTSVFICDSSYLFYWYFPKGLLYLVLATSYSISQTIPYYFNRASFEESHLFYSFCKCVHFYLSLWGISQFYLISQMLPLIYPISNWYLQTILSKVVQQLHQSYLS